MKGLPTRCIEPGTADQDRKTSATRGFCEAIARLREDARGLAASVVSTRLAGIARDGFEEHRVADRANATLSLDRGWGCEKGSDALPLDDDTIRGWFRIHREGGVDAFGTFDSAGGHRALNAEQLAMEEVPAVDADSTIALMASIEAAYSTNRPVLSCLAACRTRSSPCDTLSRFRARRVRSSAASPPVPALGSPFL